MISAGARGQEICRIFGKTAFKKNVETLANTMCLVGFRHERARVHFVVFLQGIIEIRCFKIRDGARMPFFARDEGGDTGWAGMV